ncbi:MAG: DNA repair protein RecO [Firmicutes bacterium]|nr:DNA repair protein RecO [Bacillota bacterium]
MFTDTEGMVLKQVKIAGGRRMIHIFTQKYGKISVGTGITERNSKSKAALAIRPFTYGKYEISKNRDYYNLSGAEVKKSYYGLGEDLDKYAAASHALELTDKALQEESSQPRLFSMLIDFMDRLDKGASSCETLLLAYEVKLLSVLGHSPVLGQCAICGTETLEKPLKFSIPDGGMICQNCYQEMKENARATGKDRLIYEPSFDIVNTIRYLESKPFSAFDRIALRPEVLGELKSILREYISYHLDIGPLKSESIYMT